MSNFEKKLGTASLGALGALVGTAVPLGIKGKIDRENAEEISKEEEIKRKKEPSQGGTNKVTAENKTMKAGGKVSSASSRADGCATKGKTKGRFV